MLREDIDSFFGLIMICDFCVWISFFNCSCCRENFCKRFCIEMWFFLFVLDYEYLRMLWCF